MSQPGPIAVILNVSAGTAKKHPDIGTEVGDLFRASGCDAEIILLRPDQNPTDAARHASARAPIVPFGLTPNGPTIARGSAEEVVPQRLVVVYDSIQIPLHLIRSNP
jgi:hypothetical protein